MDKANREYETPIELFDISVLVENMWRGFRQFWWIFLVLISLLSTLFYTKARMNYRPLYKATSTFVISLNQAVSYSSEYYNNATASQMSKTFPYILNSGVLQTVVARDLGLDGISESITAEAMEDTNLFELSVTGSDPQRAYDVLQSVITNYPSVAEFVIGDTQLYVLDESGVPESPINPADYMPEAKKGAFLGILLSAVVLVLYALTRNTIRKEEDLKKLLNMRCLGSIPMIQKKKRSEKDRELVLISNKKISASFLEATRTIRTRLLKECTQQDMRSLLITSTMPGEGKSTAAVNMALSLEQKGYKVLLIDGDMRHPSLAKAMGIEEESYEKGLKEVLMGKAEWKEVLLRYQDRDIYLVPGSEAVASTERLLSSSKTESMMEEVKTLADYVIIDTPPAGMLADASILTKYVDGAVFVVRQDMVRRDHVIETVQNLANTGITIAGCILNGVQTGITGYGGRYGGYGRRYGYHGYGYGGYGYGYGYKGKKEQE